MQTITRIPSFSTERPFPHSAGFAIKLSEPTCSGVSVILLGLVKLCLGLLFGGAAVLWMKAFPRPVLGLFLLLAGWGSALLITAMDIWGLPDSLKSAWNVITGR